MEFKDAQKIVANRPPSEGGDDSPSVQTQKQFRGGGSDDSFRSSNYKEDAIIDAIDQKRFLEKHAEFVSKLQDEKTDTAGFIRALSPLLAMKMAHLALGAGVSEKTQLKALQDLLDRAGHVKVQAIAAAVLDPNTPTEQLLSMITGLAKKNRVVNIEDT